MRVSRFFLLSMLFIAPVAQAQIYVCVREDGSRIYSDKKCGPNAKVVKGFENTNTKKSKVTVKPKPMEKKSNEVLMLLLEQCNIGNKQACNDWTFGGGPNALREAEEKAERDCESGLLAACEQRYCGDGATEQCRQSVLRSAELSGEHWYLRRSAQVADDGARTYQIRCIHANNIKMQDHEVKCVSNGGLQCSIAGVVANALGLRRAANDACNSAAPVKASQ
jgi:hypothetical protein